MTGIKSPKGRRQKGVAGKNRSRQRIFNYSVGGLNNAKEDSILKEGEDIFQFSHRF